MVAVTTTPITARATVAKIMVSFFATNQFIINPSYVFVFLSPS